MKGKNPILDEVKGIEEDLNGLDINLRSNDETQEKQLAHDTTDKKL